MASIRKIAMTVGKDPSTIHRWKTACPELYRAANDYTDAKEEERAAAMRDGCDDQKPIK